AARGIPGSPPAMAGDEQRGCPPLRRMPSARGRASRRGPRTAPEWSTRAVLHRSTGAGTQPEYDVLTCADVKHGHVCAHLHRAFTGREPCLQHGAESSGRGACRWRRAGFPHCCSPRGAPLVGALSSLAVPGPRGDGWSGDGWKGAECVPWCGGDPEAACPLVLSHPAPPPPAPPRLRSTVGPHLHGLDRRGLVVLPQPPVLALRPHDLDGLLAGQPGTVPLVDPAWASPRRTWPWPSARTWGGNAPQSVW